MRKDRRRRLYRPIAGLGVVAAVWWSFAGVQPAAAVDSNAAAEPARTINFARDVQPILASKCIRCHGPETHEAGLRLDDREVATTKLESGNRAVNAGLPETSELLRRITADVAERMPPEEPPLDASQIATLRQWIAEGASWPDHWSYQPLAEAAPPNLKDLVREGWCRTPIDRFIFAELTKRGLKPAPETDRRTLLRRVYFDLIGLPPAPEDVDAFLADRSADAYEKIVDRLLASPQYGERWARHWMDVVHYADSHGFEHDMPRSIWPYRDYVVAAFNADLPYAQFVREQVAGDVLAPDDPRALTATGFLATGPWDQSSLQAGEMDTDDYRTSQYLDRDDIVSTIMSTFVSTTVHCARCHDHKFDPVSQADYYALQAVVAGIDKAPREFDPDASVARQRRELLSQKSEVERQLETQDAALLSAKSQDEVAAWEQQFRAQSRRLQTVDPIKLSSAQGSDLIEEGDHTIVASGACPDKDIYTIVAQIEGQTITAVHLEVLADASLPSGGPGRQGNGNFHLTEFAVTVAPADNPSAERPVVLVNPRADFNQAPGWKIEDSTDHLSQTGWGIYPEIGRSHSASFELQQPIHATEPVLLMFVLKQELGRQHLIGRFRLSTSSEVLPQRMDQFTFPAPVLSALAVPFAQRTDQQKTLLAAFHLQRKIEGELATLPAPQTIYCGTNQFKASGGLVPTLSPRLVHLLQRGDIKQPGAIVQPGALRCVVGLPGELQVADPNNEADRRMALAGWLADRRNALTWRSIVNRIWQYHFGRGLVDTPNDFGHMGSAPTHPELMDWLAAQLRDNGGSLKTLHRMIVTSAVYRQSSRASAESTEIDADNRYLSRMNILRLDAECVHDAILKVSGQLDPTMGGAPVKQFVEVKGSGMRPEADYQNFDASNPANNRRSIYRFVFRTMPDPLMNALDCPDGTQLMPNRNVSITALQALSMIHDKFIIRQSEMLAKRVEAEHSDLDAQVTQLYRLVLCRAPSQDETDAVAAYLREFGLANACRYLLNTHEFMFIE